MAKKAAASARAGSNGPVVGDEMDPMYWVTKDRRTVLIGSMEDDHLLHTIRMLDRKAAAETKLGVDWSWSVLLKTRFGNLVQEAKRRDLFGRLCAMRNDVRGLVKYTKEKALASDGAEGGRQGDEQDLLRLGRQAGQRAD